MNLFLHLPEAHALVAKQDLPIPAWLFAWAASIVLIVSFFALSAAWRKPQLRGRTLAPVGGLAHHGPSLLADPGPLRGLGVFLLGRRRSTPGIARHRSAGPQLRDHLLLRHRLDRLPVLLSVLFGDVFRAFNPWRAIAARRRRRLRPGRAARRTAPPRLPGVARPLARRGRAARLPLARARLRLESGLGASASSPTPSRRRPALHRLHAGDDVALRH